MSLDHHHLEQREQFGAGPAGASSAGKWRWVAYLLLTLVIGWLLAYPEYVATLNSGDLTSFEEGRASGQLLGEGVGLVMGTYLLAALFLGWSKRTRRFIPGTACIFAVLHLLGDIGKFTESEAQLTAMQAWADSLGTGQVSEDDPPPRGYDARFEWAARNAREDFAAYSRARSRQHGVDPRSPPPEWISAAYMADAGRYPHVRDYFVRLRGLVQELDTVQAGMTERHVDLRLRQAGFSGRLVQDLMDSIRVGLDESMREVRTMNADMVAYVDRALALHDLLVRVDSRVHLDAAAEIAEFERESEQLQARALAEEIERRGAVLQSQQEDRRRRREATDRR